MTQALVLADARPYDLDGNSLMNEAARSHADASTLDRGNVKLQPGNLMARKQHI
jgi:hypothetical protein